MNAKLIRALLTLSCSASALLLSGCVTQSKSAHQPLRQALTFHASFDHGLDADFALGDPVLSHAPSLAKQAEAKPGLPASGEVQLVRDAGRFGHALRFTKKKSPMPFYRALKNVPYRTNNWNGTFSFWLNTDPVNELEPGFCDPIQITPRAWNDAGFFVEFEKRTNNIPFRLGVYADFKVWNPSNKKWPDVAQSEKSLAEVSSPPFARGKWTHVVFTFENFNTGRDDGVAKLYLDGAHATTLSARKQTFTWDEEKCLIGLGLSYIGLWDELAVFNRALTTAEVQQLHGLKSGVRELRAR
jgi:hypothetical protein